MHWLNTLAGYLDTSITGEAVRERIKKLGHTNFSVQLLLPWSVVVYILCFWERSIACWWIQGGRFDQSCKHIGCKRYRFPLKLQTKNLNRIWLPLTIYIVIIIILTWTAPSLMLFPVHWILCVWIVPLWDQCYNQHQCLLFLQGMGMGYDQQSVPQNG